VFQLVVFFMVSTTFILTPGISLVLPGAETSEPVVMTKLIVTIVSDDEIYLNKERYNIRGLESKLKMLTEKEKEEIKTVVIEGDEEIPYRLMVEVLDVLRKNGFKGVHLRTREYDK
jgi:biopolymer transport protein ExbD